MDTFEIDGFTISNVFTPREVTNWLPELEAFRTRMGGGHSIRNMADLPLVKEIARESRLQTCLPEAPARLVRAILFDKVPGSNWKVPWHQDLSIAVAEQVETPGFGPWSKKDGVIHVQPPAEILARMVTLRIHLDDCHIENGPVRVIPGSHRFGRIPENEIERYLGAEVACIGGIGSVLAMRPLILHASSPARCPDHRRVLHLEYAPTDLSLPVKWAVTTEASV